MLLLFLNLTHIQIISSFPWDEKKGLVMRGPRFVFPFSFWWLRKRVLAVFLRTKPAYFGLCFYLLFSPQLCLLCACFCLSASSESYVDISQCKAWGLKTLGLEVQVHRDFCLITAHLPTDVLNEDILFSNTYLPSRLAVIVPVCWWFVRTGMRLSALLTLGLTSPFSPTTKHSFLLKWRV